MKIDANFLEMPSNALDPQLVAVAVLLPLLPIAIGLGERAKKKVAQPKSKAEGGPTNSQDAVESFHIGIIKAATEKLGRDLTAKEERLVTSRGGFIALEIILDTVNSGTKEEVERYLNQEDR